ncbi:ferrous iron transport protein B [Acutalibacter caecimuris]|uniref:ferrous iron transport protein B n=1 Tax=Acutalibacter caecimuris TaxID=3093657 RepID=UPI002AC8C6A0|nr:ferrous iron transport protein B [Acutalibacter sp. M00118]
MAGELTIGFAGNPNCGKTTLFNAYTGANLKVANWPGVTVEKKEGRFRYHDNEYRLTDLPGAYSLTCYTMEEQVTRQYILSDEVDVIIDVADASALQRNLYLTLQLIELGKPVILALNMMDIVEKRGMEIDTHRLPEMLGIPVIPVSARRKTGLDILMHAAAHHAGTPSDVPLIHHHGNVQAGHTQSTRAPAGQRHKHQHHSEYAMVYSDLIEDKIDLLTEELQARWPRLQNYRWHAIKLLEGDRELLERYPIHRPDILDRSYEQDIINEKYDFIDEIIQEVVVNREERTALTDRADSLLTHRLWGLPIFLLIMAGVFFLTFTVGDWLKEYFQMGLDWFSLGTLNWLENLGVAPPLISLIVDGIITGVGGILTFLPNIIILFLALAFLEDSGYMSRVAYVMDGIMGRLGLSGRAFIPMILGFGCSVPAIMASRALENKHDRYKTMLITPFMSCSARLPIYVLFSEMFFPNHAMLAAYSMYLLGVAVAVLCAFVMRLLERKKATGNTLLIELPEYKAPSAHTIFIYVWEKVKDYLTRAGTVIFVASIIMWGLLNFGPAGYTAGNMTDTFGSLLGRWLVPFFAPLGLGYWQIVVALIAGISAKEVVVSSCAVLFSVGNVNSAAGMASLSTILTGMGFGPANALALMTFSLLYIPCAATLATIKKETDSWRWTTFAAVFQVATAWVVSFIVYNIAALVF